VFLVAFRFFQDYVVSPHLLSTGMKLHPLLIIFGVLAGASIAGVAGSFLSVPVLAALRIVYRQLLTKAPATVVAKSLTTYTVSLDGSTTPQVIPSQPMRNNP
jgi:predicted PurR-regulated permease PerM